MSTNLSDKAYKVIQSLSNIKYTTQNSIDIIALLDSDRRDLIKEKENYISFYKEVNDMVYGEDGIVSESELMNLLDKYYIKES